VTCSVI